LEDYFPIGKVTFPKYERFGAFSKAPMANTTLMDQAVAPIEVGSLPIFLPSSSGKTYRASQRLRVLKLLQNNPRCNDISKSCLKKVKNLLPDGDLPWYKSKKVTLNKIHPKEKRVLSRE